MNSTAAIFDFVNVPTLEKIATLFFVNNYRIQMHNQVEVQFLQTFDTKLHKGYLSVFILFVGIYTICRYLYYLSVFILFVGINE